MNKKYYAGIGSRNCPDNILEMMKDIAYRLADEDWILRSGGALGSDYSFQSGVEEYINDWIAKDYQEIYLPSKNFNGLSPDSDRGIYYIEHPKTVEMAKKYHPNYDKLSWTAKKFMHRNSFQIFGKDMNTPVKMVIVYTADGSLGDKTTKDTGGSGQALRIAYDHKIPIFNLANKNHYLRIKKWLDESNKKLYEPTVDIDDEIDYDYENDTDYDETFILD